MHISDPKIDLYMPIGGTEPVPCMVICPGGAYHKLAIEHEGYQWAEWLCQQGIAGAVLSYRMPEGNLDIPITDCLETLQLIKTNALEWGINPERIGFMGFSAGGHLCATVAKKSPVPLSALILMYPVIKMSGPLAEPSSRANLLGSEITEEMALEYDADHDLPANMPSVYIAASNDDPAVSPLNAIAYYEAAHRRGASTTLHIYPSGGHGWGMRPTFPHHALMLQDLSSWLRDTL